MKVTVALTTEDLCPCRSVRMEERWGPSSCGSPASSRQHELSPSPARYVMSQIHFSSGLLPSLPAALCSGMSSPGPDKPWPGNSSLLPTKGTSSNSLGPIHAAGTGSGAKKPLPSPSLPWATRDGDFFYLLSRFWCFRATRL